MPKSYTSLCEQEAHDASKHGAEHSLPCFGGLSLLCVLPCKKLSEARIDIFKLAVYFRIANKLLALPIIEIIVELF